MRKDLHTLTESGMHLHEIGEGCCDLRLSRGVLTRLSYADAILSSTDVKGFPIVSSDGSRKLAGYIGRTELRYVLGMSKYLFPLHNRNKT